MPKVNSKPSSRTPDSQPFANYLQQLDCVEAVVRAAVQVVQSIRFRFPVQGDPLANAKKYGDSGMVEVWNSARDLEHLLYPATCATKYRTSQQHMAVVKVVGIVNWSRLAFAVENLMERFDELLSHLGWLEQFTGETRGKPGPRPAQVSFQVLDILEHSAKHLLGVIEDGKQQYGKSARTLPHNKATAHVRDQKPQNHQPCKTSVPNPVEWGIGFDATSGWHVFRLTLQGWKYTKKNLVLAAGMQTYMLNCLLQDRGLLHRATVFKYFDKTRTRPKKLDSYLSRLRKTILNGIGYPDSKLNPLVKTTGASSWQLLVRIGQAEKVDPEFIGSDPELSFLPCD
jgi:hypothetical protein